MVRESKVMTAMSCPAAVKLRTAVKKNKNMCFMTINLDLLK
jgi:hypothetical protein